MQNINSRKNKFIDYSLSQIHNIKKNLAIE